MKMKMNNTARAIREQEEMEAEAEKRLELVQGIVGTALSVACIGCMVAIIYLALAF